MAIDSTWSQARKIHKQILKKNSNLQLVKIDPEELSKYKGRK